MLQLFNRSKVVPEQIKKVCKEIGKIDNELGQIRKHNNDVFQHFLMISANHYANVRTKNFAR